MKKRILIAASIITLSISSIALALNKTDYRQQEDCFLCSRKEHPEKSLYNSGIGIINLNDFSLSTLRICNEESDMRTSGSSHTTNTSGENGSIISIDSNLSRRIADVTITFRDGSKPNGKEMARFLCAECCKQLLEENTFDVAFMNYQTKEILPIEKNMIARYVDDYAIYKLDTGDKDSNW